MKVWVLLAHDDLASGGSLVGVWSSAEQVETWLRDESGEELGSWEQTHDDYRWIETPTDGGGYRLLGVLVGANI